MSTLKGMYDIFRVLFLCGFQNLKERKRRDENQNERRFHPGGGF